MAKDTCSLEKLKRAEYVRWITRLRELCVLVARIGSPNVGSTTWQQSMVELARLLIGWLGDLEQIVCSGFTAGVHT